jgi:hypothetical protein
MVFSNSPRRETPKNMSKRNREKTGVRSFPSCFVFFFGKIHVCIFQLPRLETSNAIKKIAGEMALAPLSKRKWRTGLGDYRRGLHLHLHLSSVMPVFHAVFTCSRYPVPRHREGRGGGATPERKQVRIHEELLPYASRQHPLPWLLAAVAEKCPASSELSSLPSPPSALIRPSKAHEIWFCPKVAKSRLVLQDTKLQHVDI